MYDSYYESDSLSRDLHAAPSCCADASIQTFLKLSHGIHFSCLVGQRWCAAYSIPRGEARQYLAIRGPEALCESQNR
jgi:hypothetical protein